MKIEMSNKKTDRQFGTDFMEHLAILLIALKLCGVIDWSWWVVLCPLWIGGAMFLLILVLMWILSRKGR